MDLLNFEEQSALDVLWTYMSLYGLKILAALAIFFIGKWAVKGLTGLMKKAMEKGNMDKTLSNFLGNILNGLGLAFVIIAALSQLGIETTSLAAIMVAAAGLAVGLALQGSLSNFAAGFLIILFRPFKAGDYVEIAGTSGTVSDVSIFTTTLTTPDNKTVIVPNGNITNGNITNYSTQSTRRIDMVVGVGYDDDLSKVKKTLENLVKADKRILKDPACTIAVSELADSSVNLVLRPWVNSADYWVVKFDLIEAIKTTFDKEGISIPYPQQDMRIVSSNDNAGKKKLAA